MIDPKSIKPIKYKNEDEVLNMMYEGSSIRDAAFLGGVSSKTAHKIRLKHAHLFPKKEKVAKEVTPAKIAGVKRWLTVPKILDEKIVNESRKNSLTYSEVVLNILKERCGV